MARQSRPYIKMRLLKTQAKNMQEIPNDTQQCKKRLAG